MSPGAVIVDLDGTLLDTRRRHFHAYRQALLPLGGQAGEPAPYWAAKRRAAPWGELLSRALGGRVDPEVQRRFLEDFARAIEDPAALELDLLQPGARAALTRLRRVGIDPVLVTARRDEAALSRQLADLGLSGAFAEVVATRGAPKASRIAPDLAARAGAWIGDTEEDYASARALRIPILLVTNGIRTRGRLAALRPDHLASSFGGAVRHHLAAARSGLS